MSASIRRSDTPQGPEPSRTAWSRRTSGPAGSARAGVLVRGVVGLRRRLVRGLLRPVRLTGVRSVGRRLVVLRAAEDLLERGVDVGVLRLGGLAAHEVTRRVVQDRKSTR